MNSNWYKAVMKATRIKYGQDLLLKGIPIILIRMNPNGGNSGEIPAKEIRIGRDCFIGCNSIILKGTVLGDGCVVGAGAVSRGSLRIIA